MMLRLEVRPTSESIREGLNHSSTREDRKDRKNCKLSKSPVADISHCTRDITPHREMLAAAVRVSAAAKSRSRRAALRGSL